MNTMPRSGACLLLGLTIALCAPGLLAAPAGGVPAQVSAAAAPALPGLQEALRRAAPTLRQEALTAALAAWEGLKARGEVTRDLMTVIDYTLPSTTKRLWVFDLAAQQLLHHELVSHGRNSGENLATTFSNEEGSLMTSLGAFVTGATYVGRNGYSLKLHGMDPGVNDRAESRTIVVHGAPYVSETFARKVGRLGRSWGCPAVRSEVARTLIDQVKGKSLLYAWHPSIQSTWAVASGFSASSSASSR